MSSRYTVLVSPVAKNMLVAHAAFLAKVSVEAAQKLKNVFKEAAISLRSNPERCPYLNEPYIPYQKYRKLLFDKRYIIIYKIEADIVHIEWIVDARQDYGKYLVR